MTPKKITTAKKVHQLENAVNKLLQIVQIHENTIQFHVKLFNAIAELPSVKKELEELNEKLSKEEENKIVTPPSNIIIP